jgi:hypothetical protein
MQPQHRPGSYEKTVYIPVVAAGTDKVKPIMIAPFNGVLVSAKKIFTTAITGADTNTFTAEIINGGSNGLGTTLMASKAYTNGVDAVAQTPESLTLSATVANRTFSAGDVIQYKSNQAGTGLQDEEGYVELTFRPDGI